MVGGSYNKSKEDFEGSLSIQAMLAVKFSVMMCRQTDTETMTNLLTPAAHVRSG